MLKRRKKYFIHPSSQFKFILMSILPALVMGVFCTYFLVKSGELIFRIERERLSVEVTSLSQTIQELEKEHYPKDVLEKIDILKKKLAILQDDLRIKYFNMLEKWAKIKMQILFGLFLVLILVGIISLLYSHRVAGPLTRLRKYVDMLSKGKDTPPLRFRKYDEFKELADSFEKLRRSLKEKGIIG